MSIAVHLGATLPCPPHLWRETGRIEQHIKGGVPHIFKQPYPVVEYVRCRHCRQDGFRRPGSKVVFTWRAADVAGGENYPPPPVKVS